MDTQFGPERKLNITGLCCSSWGPRAYRLEMPLSEMAKLGHNVRMIPVEGTAAWSPAWFVGWDIVIIQRQHDTGFIDMLECIPEEDRPAIIYETDDLLWALPEDSRDFDGLRKSGSVAGMQRMMRRVDAVTVSTPELQMQAKRFNQSVYCVGNGIDFDGRDWFRSLACRPTKHEVVIGWAGSIRSPRDMTVMGDSLATVLKTHPNVCFAIGGDEEQSAVFCHSLGLPEDQVYVLPTASFETYPLMISCFDVGIAPLAIHTANACKSELKLMEYGAWGIPYVASDIEPYQRFWKQTRGIAGYLVSTPAGWSRRLEDMVSCIAHWKDRGQFLAAKVRECYSLAARVDDWSRVFRIVAPLPRRSSPAEMRAFGTVQ